MNTSGCWIRAGCWTILSGIMAAPLVGAGELVRVSPTFRTPAPVPLERLVFLGIAVLGKEPVALLRDKGWDMVPFRTAESYGSIQWVAVGDPVLGYTIKAITPSHLIVIRPDVLGELRVPLTPAAAGAAGKGPKPYSKAWINSRANPMLLEYYRMPGRMDGNWSRLTNAERKQVVEFYRKHGWRLETAAKGGGWPDLKMQNVYEAERAAAIQANRDKFAQTLSPGQQVLWKQMRGFQNIYAAPDGWTAEKQALATAQQRIIDDFNASLSPAQKAEQDGIEDFTKAKWK